MNRDAHIQICAVAHGSEIFDRVVVLREAVLRKPLGLVYRAEDLLAEHDQFHLAAFVDEMPVASVILQWLPDGLAKMRQMAVDPRYQRTGLGARLVTVNVPPLSEAQIQQALQLGLDCARDMQARGLIHAALLSCQGQAVVAESLECRVE